MSIALEAAREEVKPDMTPMIDCVFLMIIFFVCVDVRVLEAKLPAYLPKYTGSQRVTVEPEEQLSVGVYEDGAGTKTFLRGGADRVDPTTRRPYRFALVGHRVQWTVGPTRVATEAELLEQLARIHGDRQTWQDDRDHPGKKKPMAVVIEPHPGTYYNDAAFTADVVRKAGFVEVNFGGGLGAIAQK